MQLKNVNQTGFLRDYWQKKPLLIRGGLQSWSDPMTGEELAGLACEEGIEARLIVTGDDRPIVEHGPFKPERFASLPKNGWTLLVQAVDHHVPEVAALLEPFRFVPNWRIDDVMVSYAEDGGGVGPHYDQYDVFLVQGAGQRRWQLGPKCDAETPLQSHDQLRLIEGFKATEEWVLEAGDILYVPPGFAHNGTAVGDGCMTYSIGFRAPARAELITDFAEHIADDDADNDRYNDPGLIEQENPGEIAASAIEALHAMALEKLTDRAVFARWFGEYTTSPKYPEMDWQPEEPIVAAELRGMLASGGALLRNPASRFAFVKGAGGRVTLFVDGQSIDCEGQMSAVAQMICAADRTKADRDFASDDAATELLVALINQGSLAFETAD